MIQIVDSEAHLNMILKSDLSKFSHIVSFKNPSVMTPKLPEIIFTALVLVPRTMPSIVGAQ